MKTRAGRWQAGDVKLTELVTRRYTLDQVNEGYQDLMDGKNLRARRPASLKGATVGLLANTKQNAAQVLDDVVARFADPGESADDTFTRILPSPRHVPLVVAGARNTAISMVVQVFGKWSGTATPVAPLPAARERPAVPLGPRA